MPNDDPTPTTDRAGHVCSTAELGAWLPIETAPKTGRKLILFYRNRSSKARTVMARWLTDEQAAETDADDVGLEGGWYECIDNWDDYTEVAIHEGEPTHWMALPPPPHVFNTEDPRCVDGGAACTDCMARGACLKAPNSNLYIPRKL